MEIITNRDESTLELTIVGIINSLTARQFEEALADLEGVTRVDLDFKDLEYVSSAGLRVLLSTEKAMRAKDGTMVIHNVNEFIMETLEDTHFTDFLNIE